MTITIHKNKRRPRWWFFLLWPYIGYNKKSITRKVTFHLNWQYKLTAKGDDPDADDMDVNKLFGIGYFWNKKESARFGCNYNNQTKKIDTFAYYHVNGQRDFTLVAEVLIGIEYLMTLNIHDMSYAFSVVNPEGNTLGNVMIPKTHKKKWSYKLGAFFGGTQVAPHDITTEIKK